MSKVSVFDHGWIDLVFEGRNQNYGAYQLRKQDSKTTILAFFAGLGVIALLVGIPAIASRLKPLPIPDELTGVEITPTTIEVEPFKMPETPKPKPEPIVEEPAAPAAAPAQSNVPTIELRPFTATSEPTPTLPTTSDFENAVPAANSTQGTSTQISLTPGTGTSLTSTTTTTAGTGDAIETFVDVAPLYPGGLKEFYKDVADRFRTPDIETSTVKVLVSFVVETDGTLSNIKATRDPGYGLGAEAVRVLKSLKATWKPGMKGGKAVRTAYSLPITVKTH
ncbi:energy transducer TonB [Flavobacterium sp. NRK1]|uniref:energy transducer TonB n=1 Tax=Flavobacterium sp. NRK1 TaxID=2954929 RepID=UPI00209333F2|nr:energy transducer TonB [Flavobacterium sp. NRK1]MCO6146801.1 energy transducer TonB [Flavobacterium sp. NRK1]